MKKTALAIALTLFAACLSVLVLPASASAATYSVGGIVVRYPAANTVYNNGTAKITPAASVTPGTHKVITGVRSYVYRTGARQAIAAGIRSVSLRAGRYTLVTKVGYRAYRLVTKTTVTNHNWTPRSTQCQVSAIGDFDDDGYGSITRARCSNWDANGAEHDTTITANPADAAGQDHYVDEYFSTNKVNFRWTSKSTTTTRIYTQSRYLHLGTQAAERDHGRIPRNLDRLRRPDPGRDLHRAHLMALRDDRLQLLPVRQLEPHRLRRERRAQLRHRHRHHSTPRPHRDRHLRLRLLGHHRLLGTTTALNRSDSASTAPQRSPRVFDAWWVNGTTTDQDPHLVKFENGLFLSNLFTHASP